METPPAASRPMTTHRLGAAGHTDYCVKARPGTTLIGTAQEKGRAEADKPSVILGRRAPHGMARAKMSLLIREKGSMGFLAIWTRHWVRKKGTALPQDVLGTKASSKRGPSSLRLEGIFGQVVDAFLMPNQNLKLTGSFYVPKTHLVQAHTIQSSRPKVDPARRKYLTQIQSQTWIG